MLSKYTLHRRHLGGERVTREQLPPPPHKKNTERANPIILNGQ